MEACSETCMTFLEPMALIAATNPQPTIRMAERAERHSGELSRVNVGTRHILLAVASWQSFGGLPRSRGACGCSETADRS